MELIVLVFVAVVLVFSSIGTKPIEINTEQRQQLDRCSLYDTCHYFLFMNKEQTPGENQEIEFIEVHVKEDGRPVMGTFL
ncbi:hypothetical protein CRE_31179 [Caenorhabditis remanei]|uniref:Uncharacterized protein n=1 Tax=Caenorhabditis remanei TaxID=31234 RepID=E3MLF9_CAERE|nr:hypothetical protein CRE_31179 [Caenorhabditis remanei]